MARKYNRNTYRAQAAFLAAYERVGSVVHAAIAARVDRTLHYGWLKGDEVYAAKFRAVQTLADDALVDEAIESAMAGDEEIVIHEGRICYRRDEKGDFIRDENGAAIPLTVRKKNTTMRIFMLKARRPEVFRESFDHNLKGSVHLIDFVKQVQAGAAAAEAD